MKKKSINAIQIALCLTVGMVSSTFSNPVLAGGTALDACMETFWSMYEETLREELGARFDVVECGKSLNVKRWAKSGDVYVLWRNRRKPIVECSGFLELVNASR